MSRDKEKMPQMQNVQGSLDRYDFIHSDPGTNILGLTPRATTHLEGLGIMNFLENLTPFTDMPLVLASKTHSNKSTTLW